MKHTKKRMCAECPFRKNSLQGYLGPWTVDGLLEETHSERGWACHTDIDRFMKATSKEQKDLTIEDNDELEQCAGAVMHANLSCKTYRNPNLHQHQLALRGCEEEKNVLGLVEFHAYHDKSKAGDRWREILAARIARNKSKKE